MKSKLLFAIPSKDRKETLEKFLRKNADNIISQGFDIVVALERNDPGHKVVDWSRISILNLQKSNKGIGYARNQIVEYADKNGYEKILFCDDNVAFSKKHPPRFDKFMECLGGETKFIAAWNSVYKIFARMWGSCYGIATKDAVAIGNYDPKLFAGEDKHLLVCLMNKHGEECFKSSDWIWFGKKRHQEGGLTFLKREEKMQKLAKYIMKTYGDYYKKIKVVDSKSITMYPKMKKTKVFEPEFKRI